MKIGDIDIDVKPGFDVAFLKWTRASIYDDDKQVIQPHPVGYHPQTIPKDPSTELSAIPYEQAEELGYAKVDFLSLNVYDKVRDREELARFVANEPDWALLLDPEVQPKLFQLHKHGEVLNTLKPKSVQQVAEVLALVRPGKSKLMGLYQKSPELVQDLLWESSGSGFQFKKSHAICYAMVIQVQLHLFMLGRI
jgi:DNA polymerase III alpha subunit